MKPRININPSGGVYQTMLALETYVRKSSGLEPSLLAGQGSALAMIAAYVLAGELGRAGSSPEEAFRRYERLLHPFMLTKQNAAEKFASSFAPKTRLGLCLRNQVTKVLGIPFVTRRVMGSTLLDRIDLPDYSKNAPIEGQSAKL